MDESVDNQGGDSSSIFRPHYNHILASVFSSRQGILTGEVNKETLRPERLVWGFSDWSGGENNRTWDERDPTVYDFAYGMNPRIRGEITGRPNRTRTSLATNDVTVRPAMAVGNSAAWIGQGNRVSFTTDGTTWTQYTTLQTGLDAAVAGAKITAVAGDGENFYYAGWASTAAGTRVLMSATTTAAGTTVVSSSTGVAPFAGLATLNGRLYAWTGRKLFELDVFQTFPLGANFRRKVGDSGVDPASTNVFGTTWWANCVAAESSIFCFYSQDGQSTVYEFAVDGGFGPLWSAPFGFTIKSMRYVNGVLYFGGHEGGDSNAKGRGMMWAMPLDTRRPVFVAHFRKQNNLNLEMQEMAGAYGNTLMIAAARSGRIFIYDADMDSITNLDMIVTDALSSESVDTSPFIPPTDALVFSENKERIGDMLTWGTKRIVAVYNPQAGASTTVQMMAYDDDEPANRQKGTVTNSSTCKLDTGDYDFGLPFDQKTLLGFDVLTEPLTAGMSIVVQYSLDGAPFVTAGTLTSATAGAAVGRMYVTVATAASNAFFFSRLRYRLTVTGTNGNFPPRIYNVADESQLVSYEELWHLIVRLKDEQDQYGNSRPSSRRVLGQTAREWLFTTARNKQVVTFLDGYAYRTLKADGTAGFTTNTVVIEQVEDIVIRKGESSAKLILRAVPT